MPEPAVGNKVILGLGNESTWGTAVTSTKWLDHKGVEFRPDWPKLEHPAFRRGSPRAHDRGAHSVPLVLQIPAIYEGMEFLWYHLFGKAPTITTPGGGTLARQQAYTFDDDTALPAGLSVEVAYRNHGAVEEYLIDGCKVQSVTIDFNVDRTIDTTWNLLGRNVVPGSFTSPTYPAELPIYWSHATVLKGGVAFDVRSASVTIETGLSEPSERQVLGSNFPREYIRTKKRMVTGKLQIDFDDPATLHNLLRGTAATPAETAAALTFQCLHPDANSIETGQAYRMVMGMPVAYLDTSSLNVSDAGIVPNEVEFFCEYNDAGAAELLTMTNRNKVTAVP